MTRNDLVREFRIATQDTVAPYLWETADIVRWLEEAEREACVRRRLLHESELPEVCQIQVVPGTAVYALHPALYELNHIAFRIDGESRRRPIKQVSTEYLDAVMCDWRDREGSPEFAIQNDTSLRLVPKPDQEGVLFLEGYRLPLETPGATTFEIHTAHHRNLLDWALFRAFSVPDAETLDLDRSAVAAQAFADYFGERETSDLRRSTRDDLDQRNKAWY